MLFLWLTRSNYLEGYWIDPVYGLRMALKGNHMTTSTQVTSHNFMSVCRQWRHFRKLSQLELELAPAANNYQRHFSWLETGPSQPR